MKYQPRATEGRRLRGGSASPRGRRSKPSILRLEALEDRTLLNAAPVAADDVYVNAATAPTEDTILTIAPANGLLTNDSDGDGHLFIVDWPSSDKISELGATITHNESGLGGFEYDPTGSATIQAMADGETALDHFWYQIHDSMGALSAPARVTLLVTGENDSPIAADDTYTMNEGEVLTIGPQGLLANDTDPDGDALQIRLASITHGDVTPGADGSFTLDPGPNFNGIVNFTYVAEDTLGLGSNLATVTVTVQAVNDAPVLNLTPAVVVLEDSVPDPIPVATVAPGPADEAGEAIWYEVTGNDNPSLFAEQPTIDAAGRLHFLPEADAFGQSTLTVVARDSGGAVSDPRTLVLRVVDINDAPSFFKGSDLEVLEDSGDRVVAWASGVSVGPSNELATGQTVAFQIGAISNPGLFTNLPGVTPDGILSFTPAPNRFGETSVSVRLVDDGSNAAPNDATSAWQQFTIRILPVNDAPTFSKLPGLAVTVPEDSGLSTIPGCFFGVDPGAGNESAQTVSLVVATDRPELFSTQPTADPVTGDFSFTPAPDAFGTATITVVAMDNGGTANGGEDTSLSQSFPLVIQPVNDPPSFTPGTNQQVFEDAPATTIAGWATDISAGPGEDAQGLQFIVTTNYAALFLTPPAIDPVTGDLTFTPAADAHGTATVQATAEDLGGLFSVTQVFLIEVISVNDAPSFTLLDTVTVDEDSGLHAIAGAAVVVSLGDGASTWGDEGTAVTFDVSADLPYLFAQQPEIDAAGTLTFEPAANAYGTATVTVVVVDNGGTANGGNDTSVLQTFTITIDALADDAPVAVDDSFAGCKLDTLPIPILANDYDPDPGHTPLLEVVELDLTGMVGSLTTNAQGDLVFDPSGAFDDLDPGQSATTSFLYRISDPTGLKSNWATVEVIVSGGPVSSGEELIAMDLEFSTTPWETDIDDAYGGRTFWVNLYIEDVRETPEGVVGGVIDLVTSSSNVSATGNVAWGSSFNLNQQFQIQGGQVDELGALVDETGVGAGQRARFVSVEFTRVVSSPPNDNSVPAVLAAEAAEGTLIISPPHFALIDAGTGSGVVPYSDVAMPLVDIELILGDFNHDQSVDHGDMGLFLPRLFTDAADELYSREFDLNDDGAIDQGDMGILQGRLFQPTIPPPGS